jgi:hypothetical protein
MNSEQCPKQKQTKKSKQKKKSEGAFGLMGQAFKAHFTVRHRRSDTDVHALYSLYYSALRLHTVQTCSSVGNWLGRDVSQELGKPERCRAGKIKEEHEAKQQAPDSPPDRSPEPRRSLDR